ncbi:MAG: hypothetical protein ACK5ML_04915 [Lachnospiraceae bacterium]
MKKVRKIILHALFIIPAILITFLILDNYNPTMNFVNNTITLILLWVFCILSIINSVITMIALRRKNVD